MIVPESISNPSTILKNASLKVTRARTELLFHLERLSQPFTAEDVCSSLVVNGGHVHRSTVYRDLSSFVRSGILKELSIHGTNVHFYELADTSHHHHFICKKCFTITAIISNKVETALEKFEQELSQQGLAIEYHSLKLYGLCALCKINN